MHVKCIRIAQRRVVLSHCAESKQSYKLDSGVVRAGRGG